MIFIIFMSCGGKSAETKVAIQSQQSVSVPTFDSDSAFEYVKMQTDFGPRVPNTKAHQQCGNALIAKLKSFGATVDIQETTLTAFDGTPLHARNILGRFNLDKPNRILLMAHWDTRPWADADANESLRTTPGDGANDGASGVGVLMEIARQLSLHSPSQGIDILFVDAEDWGDHDNDESWALGARHFVANPPSQHWPPREVVLLDMVGGAYAQFAREYFSQSYAPSIIQKIWNSASEAGYSEYFINTPGGGVTDDHVEFIKAGIPAIDIIEYCSDSPTGFNPTWHTHSDNLNNIDKNTLKAVGQTLLHYIYTIDN